MMSEPKPFASLNAGLLARKGAARPAMRRQPLTGLGLSAPHGAVSAQDDLGWNDMGYDVDPDVASIAPSMDLKPFLSGSVLGNEEADGLADIPEPQVVDRKDARAQQAELALRYDGEFALEERAKLPQKSKKSAPSKRRLVAVDATIEDKARAAGIKIRARDKAAFTLRLDADRHLALRLASAVTNQSSQVIMTRLLDEYLASVPEIGDLAGRVAAVPPARQRTRR